MRTIAALTLMFFTTPAFAGGIGLIGQGGVHSARAYYYSESGQQGIDNQIRPNFGGGMEVLLGDSSDRIQGIIRLYANLDAPLNDPETEGISQDEAIFPAASEVGLRTDGVCTMGVQWGLLGDPDGTQLILTSLIGSAFITRDNLEYLVAEVGIGGTYTINNQLQFFGTLNVAGRYRKRVSHTEGAFVGVRYMFD
ncbi:MAG: hypothetical protein AAFV53_37990 [Myxococcota bacterium]